MREVETPVGSYVVQAQRFEDDRAAFTAWERAEKWIMGDRGGDASVWRTAQLDRETEKVGPWFVVTCAKAEHRAKLRTLRRIVRACGGVDDDEGLGENLLSFVERRIRVALDAAAEGRGVKQRGHYGKTTVIRPGGVLRPRRRPQG